MYKKVLNKRNSFVLSIGIIIAIALLVLAIGCTAEIGDMREDNAPQGLNKVYESTELVGLVMRLSGCWIHGQQNSEYQQRLSSTFAEFADHPAVDAAREAMLEFGNFSWPMAFALYMERVGTEFQFREGTDFCEDYYAPFSQEWADGFLDLLNDFYKVSGFAEFYQEHIPYYEAFTQRLMDELWGKIYFDWFYQFGFGPDNMRAALWPSGGTNGFFGPTILDINYAIIPRGQDLYFGDILETVIHEFAHSIGNPIAAAWYADETKEEFRRLSYDSIDLGRLWFYPTSEIMAAEYVTRAFTILYMVEAHGDDLVPWLMTEIMRGFIYIETVYAMITEHEPIIVPGADIFALLFGEDVEYTMGEEERRVVQTGDRIYFQGVDLGDIQLPLEDFEVARSSPDDMWGTQIGDVIFGRQHATEFLMIDLGGEDGFRHYALAHLDGDNYTITSILGIQEYSLGELQYWENSPDRIFYYRHVSFRNFELSAEKFMPMQIGYRQGFSTQFGDVIVVTEEGRRGCFIYIDVGDADVVADMYGVPRGEMRFYTIFPLDVF